MSIPGAVVIRENASRRIPIWPSIAYPIVMRTTCASSMLTDEKPISRCHRVILS
ncbi:MAG TPA: hypothetical protein VMV41_16955 [Cellulomonadaceae bacterium]|nr:hypothetical protein [Cellulomonadaceae bacterium]